MRRWLGIAVLALAGAGVVSVLLRQPRPVVPAPEGAAPAETVAVRVTISPAGVVATPASIDVGRAVALTVDNAAAAPSRLRLAGYEDRVDSGPLAPGATWRGAFLADRPGDDLAWILDDRPAGRLAVQGSHLVEGHR